MPSQTLMVTDPPYGVQYDSSWRYKAGISVPAFSGVAGDELKGVILRAAFSIGSWCS